MEANISKIRNMRISRTIEALEKNNYKAVYVPEASQALALVKTLLTDGQTVSAGGSVTLNETGIRDYLKSGKYQYFDRYDKSLTPEQRKEVCRKAMTSETYFMSSNAITETGLLYNVDGMSNRTSALLYGPDKIIIVAGYNKIVPTLEDAIKRVKNIAAPANAVRLDRDSYCAKHGHCCSEEIGLTGECKECICHNYVISGPQEKDRVTVIIVGEELGY